MSIPADDFTFYRDFLHQKSGLWLSEQKIYLLVSRLTPVAKKYGFAALEDLTAALKRSALRADCHIAAAVTEAMTTNETSFFRDDRPFRYFCDKIVPCLVAARAERKSLRIWSAACSTGQEPYSIAMSLCDVLPGREQWNIEILATDLSESVLEQARTGRYSQFEVQRGVPVQRLVKYFDQDGQSWVVRDGIRGMVRFSRFNLLDKMAGLGRFDMIFCRNVLIYFNEDVKKDILCRMVRVMAGDGCVLLGGAESALGLSPDLRVNMDCPGLYTLQGRECFVDAGKEIAG